MDLDYSVDFNAEPDSASQKDTGLDFYFKLVQVVFDYMRYIFTSKIFEMIGDPDPG